MTHDGTDDKDLDQALAEMRRSYNAPPEQVPLDVMWASIEREQFGARSARVPAGGGWVGARAAWWMGIAAALVLGVGIGRLTRPSPTIVATADTVPRTPELAPRTPDYDGTTARY